MRVMAENPMGRQRSGWRYKLYRAGRGIRRNLPIPQQYFCDQMQSFADIVNGTGDGLAANIQDGQANQHLLDAIVESAEKGTWLSL